MKFGLLFVNVGPFAQPEGLGHLARTAESLGFESIWAIEHVVIPVGYKSKYPYDPSGKLPIPDDAPLPDPLLALSYAAAITTRIKLATGIVILPQRHPIYVAKEVATLDVLSHGRAIFGIGIGWLQEEFQTLGIPFQDRAGRTAESVRAIRSLWGKEPRAFSGKRYRWGVIESQPKPVQPGGVPIVIGGHSELSARRAARYGDGFFPGVFSVEQFRSLLAVLHEECSTLGRNPAEIELTAPAGEITEDVVKTYADLGVSRIITPAPMVAPADVEKNLGEIARRVIG